MKSWDVETFVHVARVGVDVPCDTSGRLRIMVDDDGGWTVAVRPTGQTFSLILQGDKDMSASEMLHQTLSFLFSQAA